MQLDPLLDVEEPFEPTRGLLVTSTDALLGSSKDYLENENKERGLSTKFGFSANFELPENFGFSAKFGFSAGLGFSANFG